MPRKFSFSTEFMDRRRAWRVYLHGVNERVTHSAGALPTLCRILCKRAIDDFTHCSRNVRRALAKGNSVLFEDGADGVVDATALAQVERERACQQAVSRHANGVNV